MVPAVSFSLAFIAVLSAAFNLDRISSCNVCSLSRTEVVEMNRCTEGPFACMFRVRVKGKLVRRVVKRSILVKLYTIKMR
jgi:hypothetical protein